MKTLAAALMVGKSLLVSPEHPIKFSRPSHDVWVSSPDHLEVHPMPGAVVIKGLKTGVAFVTGLGEAAPQRMAVVRAADYRAVTKCRTLSFDDERVPLTVRDELSLERALKCGFETLAIAFDPSPSLESRVRATEEQARRSGLRFQPKGWADGQRQIVVRGDSEALARKKLGPLGPLYSITLLQAPKPGRTLIFELTLFEVSRSQASRIGLRLPDSISATSDLSRPLSLKIVEPGLGFGADWAEANGVGRVLARPQIRTKPGERAQFQSGGELPIKSVSAYSASTTWKPYGLILHLEPDAGTVTGAGEVGVALKLEMSEPDYSTAIEGVPGMVIRKLESRFDLRTEETTILSSMIQTRSGARKGGPAGLMRVPLLGDLLSSHQDDRQDLELWFGLRPTWDEIPFPSDGPFRTAAPHKQAIPCPRWKVSCG